MAATQTAEFVVVRPEQDLVASNLEPFHQTLQDLVKQGKVHLAIDLAKVGIIDSKGLAVFLMCHKSVSAAGGRLVVLTTDADFKHLFHVMRMDQHFTVAESL
jgi:anti-anti-sigma factor